MTNSISKKLEYRNRRRTRYVNPGLTQEEEVVEDVIEPPPPPIPAELNNFGNIVIDLTELSPEYRDILIQGLIHLENLVNQIY